MALISLALPAAGRLRSVLLTMGLGGAALFFGDAMITPAISVLSAIEGGQMATPALKPYVVPVAAGLLIALFAMQGRGSGRIGRLFGPVMAAWFVVLGLAGIVHLAAKPKILVALNPRYALACVAHADGWVAFTVLGSVFLALTGGEALYADMGHFRPSSDPHRLVLARHAGIGAELFRPRRVSIDNTSTTTPRETHSDPCWMPPRARVGSGFPNTCPELFSETTNGIRIFSKSGKIVKTRGWQCK
jgi:hypothetical protein